MTTDLLISVIIPAYNCERTIRAAILSMNGGSVRPDEVIVVDDGSTDGTAMQARTAIADAGLGAAVRVISRPNGGPGAARNTGSDLARGRFLAFLDADDIWFDWTFEVCNKIVSDNPDAALIFLQSVDFVRGCEFVAPQRATVRLERYPRFLAAVKGSPDIYYASCNVIIRRDVLEALGGFTTETSCSEDSDLFLRADRHGPCILVRAPVLMGHAVGNAGSLTGNAPAVMRGLEYLMARDRAGIYPGGAGGDPLRVRFLAGSVIYSARIAFAMGHVARAYGLLFRHAGLVFRGGRGRWFARMVLTPMLHVLRPQNYPFRRRPE